MGGLAEETGTMHGVWPDLVVGRWGGVLCLHLWIFGSLDLWIGGHGHG